MVVQNTAKIIPPKPECGIYPPFGRTLILASLQREGNLAWPRAHGIVGPWGLSWPTRIHSKYV